MYHVTFIIIIVMIFVVMDTLLIVLHMYWGKVGMHAWEHLEIQVGTIA